MFRRTLIAAATLAAAASTSWGLERVTLSNGFELNCVRREAISPTRARLYTSEANYIEVDSATIREVATIEEPPAPQPATPLATATTQKPLTEIFATAGAKHRVDVDLLAAVVRAESAGNNRAVSHAGARGLMQLMPGTATELGVKDSFAPDQNVDGGSAYLDQLLTRYHDNMQLALAAYNAGPAAVDRYHGVPPYRETRAYVARVVREFNRRKLAQVSATR